MKRVILTTIILVSVLSGGIALASDITDAAHSGVIQVSNNGTATTNVATTMTLASQPLIDMGLVEDDFSNVAVRSNSGADVPFMPSVNSTYPWCLWVPSISGESNLNYTFYTGNASLDSDKYYFPGPAGMSVADDPTLELGDNFTIEQTGWIDTTPFSLEGAIFSDNFSTDDWTDVGTKMVVDTGNGRLEYESERSGVDTRCYRDLTAISDTEWALHFTWHPTSDTEDDTRFMFGMFDVAANTNGYATDGLLMWVSDSTAKVTRYDGGVGGSSATINVAQGNTYYVRLERTNLTGARLSLFTDAGMTTHTAGSPQTLAIPSTVTGLRYLQASNYDDNLGAAKEQIGWIGDVALYPGKQLVYKSDAFSTYIDTVSGNITSTIYGGSTVTTHISSDNYTVATTANTTHLALYIDNILKQSVALGGVGVPDNGENWVFCQATAMPYMSSTNITINGVLSGSWQWNYSETFPDDSANSNTATPTFRTTSSDADVSASLISFAPIEQAQSDALPGGTWPTMVTDVPEQPTTTYTEDTRPGFFFEPIVHTFLDLGGIPDMFFWYNFCFFIIIAAGMIAYRIHPSLIMKCIVMGALMIFFALPGLNVYGMFTVIYFTLFSFGIIIISRSQGI